jgi:competence CoiA-like predicted nuclease
MENQRTIQTILSLETGNQYEADYLFDNQYEREAEIFQLRTKIEEQLQKGIKDYVCLYCKQPVAVRGRKNLQTHSTHFYFTHPYKSDDCIIKTVCRLSEEEVRCIKYNGVKESKLHELLKNEIAYYLGLNQNSSVIVDKIYKDKTISRKWRKPDVLAIFPDKKIAFELQLSTTFLSVIVGRTLFYKESGIFLIWVFPNFSLENDLQKFTQKDVYYNNNFNVYVFDKSAKEQSEIENELVLKCYYKEYIDLNYRVEEEWVERFIKLSNLTFNYDNYDVYCYDSETEKQKILDTIAERKRRKELIEKAKENKVKIDDVLAVLRKFYANDILFPFKETFLDTIETEDEIKELNNELKFSTEKTSFISELFFKREKPFFLAFICQHDVIEVDTSKIFFNGKSIIEELITLQYVDFRNYSSLLFRKGYKLTKDDEDILFGLSKDISDKENYSKWAFLYFLSSISKKEFATEIKMIDYKILNPILSLKKKFVIGANFENIKQVCNNVFEYHKAFGDLFIKALKTYNIYDKLLSEDKKGKLKEKINKYYIENPGQETKYNEIIFDLFPELEN